MYSRHDLVWLSGRGWDAALARALPGQHAVLEQWRREDWPAIVRRADPGVAPGCASLGVAPPPAPGGPKVRIALLANAEDVARRIPALALSDAASAAPEKWRVGLGHLVLQSAPFALRAYGSLAMQAVTGQPYLTPASDIDLLFQPADQRVLRMGLALLEQHAALLPLDGEIVFPSGAAVAWKEWIHAGHHRSRVLVKDRDAVRLASAAELLATLEWA
jgi:phosphoribosyl-dephospho-CoA transferase